MGGQAELESSALFHVSQGLGERGDPLRQRSQHRLVLRVSVLHQGQPMLLPFGQLSDYPFRLAVLALQLTQLLLQSRFHLVSQFFFPSHLILHHNRFFSCSCFQHHGKGRVTLQNHRSKLKSSMLLQLVKY